MSDALVVASPLGIHGAHQRIGAHHRREVTEHLLASHASTLFHRRRVQVEQRERLADQHFCNAELALGQTFAGRQEVVEAVTPEDELRAETPVKWLQNVGCICEEAEPSDVVAIDVTTSPQREVHGREVLVEHGVTQSQKLRGAHRLFALRSRDHSSIQISSSARPHSRSRVLAAFVSVVTTSATWPAAR